MVDSWNSATDILITKGPPIVGHIRVAGFDKDRSFGAFCSSVLLYVICLHQKGKGLVKLRTSPCQSPSIRMNRNGQDRTVFSPAPPVR